MKFSTKILMVLTGSAVLLLAPTICHAQKVVGVNCYENGRYVFYKDRATCPPTRQANPPPSPPSNSSDTSSSDDSARREEAARAEAARKRAEEEAEAKRREEAAAKEKFDRDKADALNSLKSISSGNLDIKDSAGNKINGSDFGLKGVDDSKTNNVVDARDVPTGLPRAVEEAIPHTPAGDRVRKGFQAIQAHDWKVALAWFQDALNHDPGDPSLKRLVDLAKFTLNYREKTSRSVPNTQLPNQSPASASGNDTAIKPADDGFHGDWVTYAAVVGIAARARAEKVYKDFKTKYGDRNAVGRTIALSKAMRGDGYSKEELNADLEKARAVYEKVLRDRKTQRDRWSNPPVYGRVPPMKPRVYPDSPWGKFLRFYDNLVNPPEVYRGPEMDEVTLGGKG